MSTFKLTPASEFRRNREEGVPVELPSTGRHVALRSFTLAAFIVTVQIPDELTAYVEAQLIGTTEGKAHTPESLGMTMMEFMRQDRGMLELYAEHMFVHPKVRPSNYEGALGEDEILASDLDYMELLEAFAAVQLPVTRLQSFRDKTLPAIHALRPTGKVEDTSE